MYPLSVSPIGSLGEVHQVFTQDRQAAINICLNLRLPFSTHYTLGVSLLRNVGLL